MKPLRFFMGGVEGGERNERVMHADSYSAKIEMVEVEEKILGSAEDVVRKLSMGDPEICSVVSGYVKQLLESFGNEHLEFVSCRNRVAKYNQKTVIDALGYENLYVHSNRYIPSEFFRFAKDVALQFDPDGDGELVLFARKCKSFLCNEEYSTGDEEYVIYIKRTRTLDLTSLSVSSEVGDMVEVSFSSHDDEGAPSFYIPYINIFRLTFTVWLCGVKIMHMVRRKHQIDFVWENVILKGARVDRNRCANVTLVDVARYKEFHRVEDVPVVALNYPELLPGAHLRIGRGDKTDIVSARSLLALEGVSPFMKTPTRVLLTGVTVRVYYTFVEGVIKRGMMREADAIPIVTWS